MDSSVFKLLVSVVVALAVIYVLITYLLPGFLPSDNSEEMIKKTIVTAIASQGKAVDAEKTVYEGETRFSAETFRENKIEVKFECNSAPNCCEKGTKCNKGIEWKENAIYFSQKKALNTFARCESRHGIAACTVFFGQEPAQVKIDSINVPAKINLAEENSLRADLVLENSGGVFAPSVFATANLYRLNSTQTTRKMVSEKKSSEIELAPGEKKTIEIEIPLELASDYVLEIIAKGENAGFETASVFFTAAGEKSSNCIAREKGETMLDSRTGKCETSFSCEKCSFAFECRDAWKQKEPSKQFTEEDPVHAIEITEPTNGSCTPGTIPPVNQYVSPGPSDQSNVDTQPAGTEPIPINHWNQNPTADPSDLTQ